VRGDGYERGEVNDVYPHHKTEDYVPIAPWSFLGTWPMEEENEDSSTKEKIAKTHHIWG
jgi:hypothetical protein